MLTVENLGKRFGKKEVLEEISFTLEPGRIYGLLGRNGAGKSTLLNIINNRLRADSGTVLMDGEAVFENDRQLSRIFLVNDKNLFPGDLKVGKAFAFAQKLYPAFDMNECKRLSDLFDLNVKAKISRLSTGYQSIFRLILALSMPAEVLFFDEPVLGLDATHRELFYGELIENYQKNPRTIVISTHLIEEISHLIERALVLYNKRLVIDADVEELLAGAYMITGDAEAVDKLTGLQVIGQERLGNLKTLYVTGLENPELEGMTVQRMDLQKLFVELTKGGRV